MNILKTVIIILISLIISIKLNAQDYYISFQYYVQNYQLKFSNFNCSKAMEETDGSKKLLFSFPCSEKNVKNCCLKNENIIIENLLKNSAVITSNDNIVNYSLTTSAKLTYLPRRFDIIIKNGKIYFYIKGEE